MRIALYQPDIAANTGTLLRLGACLGVAVDIVGPAGFDLSDRALRRAGLDYLAHVEMVRHVSWPAYLAWRTETGQGRLVLLTAAATLPHHRAAYHAEDTLLLGRESAGVPPEVHAMADLRVRVAMRPAMRSLNVAVAGAMVLGEALRQTGCYPAQ